jgi:cytochrome c-type biogenesis protein CcmH/NrfG
MFKDTFDKLCWTLLAAALVSLVIVLAAGSRLDGKPGSGLGKALERDMAYRGRVELIKKLYGPVENLHSTGNKQEALLKLDELIRQYPGEAHGHILQGQILWEMGAFDEAVSSFVEGVTLNGDYVDAKSPLSRRAEIQRLVDEGLKKNGARAAANPGNRSVAVSLRKVSYLKSRLAGGCE